MRRSFSLAAVLVGALVLATTAFGANGGLTPPDPESPNAGAINDTYYLLLVVTGLVFVAVQGSLVAFVIRYRRRRRPVDAEGPQIHGNTRLEVLWTVVPLALVTVIVGFVFYKLPDVSELTGEAIAAPGEENYRVDVFGRQFYWEFRYPDGRVTYDTLVVPVDTTVDLTVTAPDYDVVHSWWIPALGGKIDAIPGNVNHTWFRARRTGEFDGACTEYCGLQHNAMRMRVLVVDRARLESERARFVGNGRSQFEAACAKCHNLQGPELIGPTLKGNPILANRDALSELVRNGQNAMPAVGRGWSEQQMTTLLQYVQRMAGAQSGG